MRIALQAWTGERELSDALLALSQRLPSARFVITTLGKRGSVMLCQREATDDETLADDTEAGSEDTEDLVRVSHDAVE